MDINQLSIYQIYPKSFHDSNGDGIGDIQGIIQKLDYIQNLGVDCIWLTPIYPSPQRDNGYDVADYTAINPTYGTMADFDELIAQCKTRGMFIMLDMVFNHTSDQHMWFKQAATDPIYRDYYIFKNSPTPPTNWVSKFGGSTWEKYGDDDYYLHLFDVSQPDLNWENPQVRQEIYNIMHFWLEKGIRGFRFDVINLISKPDTYQDDHQEQKGSLALIGDGRRFYTDGPKIHTYLKELARETFGKYPDTLTVGEMSSTTIEHCIRYSNPAENELDMTFSFHHLKVDYQNGDKWTDMPFDFAQLKRLLTDWQVGMAAGGGHNALFWSNHDQPRVVSRFGHDSDETLRIASAKMLANAMYLLKGTPYIYQGEEIGMTNPGFDTIDSYRDVESLNIHNILINQGMNEPDILNILAKKSRDNSRTPMQWNNAPHAGFTTGTPWIATAGNYLTLNATQTAHGSIYRHYQELLALRKELPVLGHGRFEPLWLEHPQVFAYKRVLDGVELLVLCNFYNQHVELELDQELQRFVNGQVILANTDSPALAAQISLRPYESFAVLVGR